MLAHDTDPIVIEFANAVGELLATAPANPSSQPSSGPTTGPTTGPGITRPTVPSPFGPSLFGPGLIPGTQPTTRPAGPDLVIPSLPLTLPPPQPGKP